MKKIFPVFLLFLAVMVLMTGCNSNNILKEINFSDAEKISFRTPDEREIFLNEDDKEKVIDILSKATLSGKKEDFDGGLSLNVYIDDKVKYVTIYDYEHISAGKDSMYMYEIPESDYYIIDDIYNTSVKTQE